MKRIILIVIMIISSLRSNCQTDHVKMLIGSTETDVRNYFDSLNKLHYNAYSKIKQSATDYGDLMLENDFSQKDESYYTCYSIITVFKRLDKDLEVCTEQLIIGDIEFAQSNLAFLKDHFKFVTDGRWERPSFFGPDFKIVASFQRREGQYPSYNITYTLENTK